MIPTKSLLFGYVIQLCSQIDSRCRFLDVLRIEPSVFLWKNLVRASGLLRCAGDGCKEYFPFLLLLDSAYVLLPVCTLPQYQISVVQSSFAVIV
jgi:hypothetical protein